MDVTTFVLWSEEKWSEIHSHRYARCSRDAMLCSLLACLVNNNIISGMEANYLHDSSEAWCMEFFIILLCSWCGMVVIFWNSNRILWSYVGLLCWTIYRQWFGFWWYFLWIVSLAVRCQSQENPIAYFMYRWIDRCICISLSAFSFLSHFILKRGIGF